ncbi:type II toxin-antitoxin system prevent-host-death family antitoxin [Micromonospora sp. NPDC003241]
MKELQTPRRLRNQPAELLGRVRGHHERVTVTVHGWPSAVLVHAAHHGRPSAERSPNGCQRPPRMGSRTAGARATRGRKALLPPSLDRTAAGGIPRRLAGLPHS